MAAHASPVRRIVIVLVVLALAAALGWWLWSTYGNGSANTNGTRTLTGTVEAAETQVSSVMAGRIVSSSATEGVIVKKGQIVFKLDDSLLALQVSQAEAGVRAAEASLAQAKKDKLSSAEIAAAQARLDQANDALSMARVQRGYTVIVAPTAGVITAVAANAGENASPGRALATVSDLERLHVSVYVPETEIGQVQLGQNASITTDSSSDTFRGRVDFISSQAEFTPSNIETKEQRVKLVYEVRVRIENGGDVLKPGMPVDVVLE